MLSTKAIATAAAAFAIAAVSVQTANAAPRDRGFSDSDPRIAMVNTRIGNQYRRIRRGRRTGRLNWVEARRLRFELSHIRGFRARYLGDGFLNRREVRHLRRLLNQNSRRIRRLSRNGWGGWRPWQRDRPIRRRLSQYNGF